MLLAVEIIERFLEAVDAVAVFSEHEHKAGIPHKNVTVKSGVDIGRDKAALFRRLSEVAESYLPRLIVGVYFIAVTRPHGLGQSVPLVLKIRQRRHIGLHGNKLVELRIPVLDISGDGFFRIFHNFAPFKRFFRCNYITLYVFREQFYS